MSGPSPEVEKITEIIIKIRFFFSCPKLKFIRRHRAGPGSTMGSVIKCTAKVHFHIIFFLLKTTALEKAPSVFLLTHLLFEEKKIPTQAVRGAVGGQETK